MIRRHVNERERERKMVVAAIELISFVSVGCRKVSLEKRLTT